MLLRGRDVGKLQATKCFMRKDLQFSDFFMAATTSKEGDRRQLWKMTSNDRDVERLILGNTSFLVPIAVLNQIPARYLIQENVTMLRLKLGKGDDVIILFPGVDGYDLLKNDKVLSRIVTEFKKKARLFGMFIDEKEKILYFVEEVSLTLNELVKNWDIWTDILKGYFPLIVPYEKSRETGLFMTINERYISPKETFDDVCLRDLANFVMNTLYSR